MEASHGVDVSWLHHSKDSGKEPNTPGKEKDKGKQNAKVNDNVLNGAHAAHKSHGNEANGALPPKTNGDPAAKGQHHVHKLHLHSKQSDDAVRSPPVPPSPTSKDPKSRTPDSKRRGSWISNISSKFSSSSSGQPNHTSSPAPATVSTPEVKEVTTSASGTSPPTKENKKGENAQQPISSPKSGGPSFLQNALRRLSSSGGASGGKASVSGGVCPRRVMNVDPHRERCQIDDLQPAKLRRVSFCVDVEIAPPTHYDEPEEDSPPPSSRRSNPSQPDKAMAAKKSKDKNVKMKEKAEGEALKHPEAIAEAKDKTGDVAKTEASIEPTPNSACIQDANSGAVGEPKKKKKRTEAEKAERRERKRQAALANGTIPMEFTINNSSSEEASIPGTPTSFGQERPTTDPLRIYRRCCQLRESPVLKRVADQLSAPNASDPNQAGVVTCIDLTGFKIPLPDTVTLGDWLAVVPVRRLILEECDLTDEAVRVILAGLLGAKTPDQARFNRHLAKGTTESGGKVERLGVVEKVSLKDNPRVTREGWRHISYFINMSKSLKAIDISGISLPQQIEAPPKQQQSSHGKANTECKALFNVAEVFEKCLAERVGKDRLEELVMAKCGLDTNMVESVVRGATACGVKRLGLAYNDLDHQGIEAVCNFLLAGRCEGLDLGGNKLGQHIQRLVTSLDDSRHPLWALSVADCGLTPHSLKLLLPSLVKLPNFKFIDLSHNHQLFETQPDAISLLRKYLPHMTSLRRIHLHDVAMGSEQCIALAEVLPEISTLAHIGISENEELAALASAKEEELQEEACAYYASIMAAVRVSRSIVSVDMDMPTQDSSELVKALAKQVLAYALRNVERGTAAEALGSEGRQDSLVEVPDILLHLVGHVDGFPENHDGDEPAPSEDYIVSGTGVVKALSVCLGNKASDRQTSRSTSRDRGGQSRGSGRSTPLQVPQDVDQFKAKDMSKNLLDSARKIRTRLQPALAREAKGNDEATSRRLQFLDATLGRMIERFEEEYPDCRRKPEEASATDDTSSESENLESSQIFTNPFSQAENGEASQAAAQEDEDEDDPERKLSRRGSDASLAARYQAHEEGQMHLFGQQIRRSILAPTSFDYHHQKTGENESQHLQVLRARLEAMPGDEIKERVQRYGVERVISELGTSVQELRRLQEQDPESFAKFHEAQHNADRNTDSQLTPPAPEAVTGD